MKTTTNKKTMLYIMSPSYSGSTLLTFLLANHSEISTVGELKATSMGDISNYKCSCGELLLECGFWSSLGEKLKANGEKLDFEDFETNFSSKNKIANKLLSSRVRGRAWELLRMLLLKLGPASSEYKRILHRNKIIADAVSEIQGGRVFMDGSKNCNRLLYFADSDMWDLKVVNLVRDERGQLCSLMRREKSGMQQAIDRLVHVRNEQKATLATIGKGRYININYNELCRNTLLTLNQIYQFIGVSEVDDANLSKSKHHILGNSMRLSNVDEIKVDDRWKEDLTEQDLAIYAPYAGKINSILGNDVIDFES